jgi:hypothetical protein
MLVLVRIIVRSRIWALLVIMLKRIRISLVISLGIKVIRRMMDAQRHGKIHFVLADFRFHMLH